MGWLDQHPPVWYAYDQAVKLVIGGQVLQDTKELVIPIAQVPVDETWMIQRYFLNTGNPSVDPNTMVALTLTDPTTGIFDLTQAVDYVPLPRPLNVVCDQPILVPPTSSIHAWFLTSGTDTTYGWKPSVRMQYQILKRSS
jgi:hypothetical protein